MGEANLNRHKTVKDDKRRRGMPSPDEGAAIALTFSPSMVGPSLLIRIQQGGGLSG
jgi:hypothetical protein